VNEIRIARRNECPACRCAGKEIYRASFSSPPISTYLKDSYPLKEEKDLCGLGEKDFILDECESCGLVYQRMIPNDSLMKKLYEEWVDPESSLHSTRSARPIEYFSNLAREMNLLVRHFGTVPSALDFFDFGMGRGDWCRMAKAHGCSVCGHEISQPLIDHARASGIPTLKWEDIPERLFDVINLDQVLEHVSDPRRIVEYLRGSLKPTGLMRISVPDGEDIRRRLRIGDWKAPKGTRNSLNPVAPMEHVNCFSRSSLLRMANLAGFVPVKLRAWSLLDTRILECTVRDALLPFYRFYIKGKTGQNPWSTSLYFRKAG
jgi:SAM-dependent methyltransferase